jgi:hypothetical protein
MIINDNPSLARLYISFLHEEGTTRKQGCTQFLKEFNMPAFLPSFSVSKLTSSGSNPTKSLRIGVERNCLAFQVVHR